MTSHSPALAQHGGVSAQHERRLRIPDFSKMQVRRFLAEFLGSDVLSAELTGIPGFSLAAMRPKVLLQMLKERGRSRWDANTVDRLSEWFRSQAEHLLSDSLNEVSQPLLEEILDLLALQMFARQTDHFPFSELVETVAHTTRSRTPALSIARLCLTTGVLSRGGGEDGSAFLT